MRFLRLSHKNRNLYITMMLIGKKNKEFVFYLKFYFYFFIQKFLYICCYLFLNDVNLFFKKKEGGETE